MSVINLILAIKTDDFEFNPASINYWASGFVAATAISVLAHSI